MCKCTFGKENMTLENKLNITDSTEFARMEEKIRTEFDTGRKWNCPLSENRATIP